MVFKRSVLPFHRKDVENNHDPAIDGAAVGTTPTATNGDTVRRPHDSATHGKRRNRGPVTFNHINDRARLPTIMEWIKVHWGDVTALVIIAIFAIAFINWSPLPKIYFPIEFENGQVVYPEMAHPKLKHQYVPFGAAVAIALGAPILFIFIMQFWLRSFWDLNNGIFGVLLSNLMGTCSQVFLKLSIGGLRPNFLEVCKPNVEGVEGEGFKKLFFTPDVCTNTNKRELASAFQSFPSGHSEATFAGLLFLSLYINAKFKVFTFHSLTNSFMSTFRGGSNGSHMTGHTSSHEDEHSSNHLYSRKGFWRLILFWIPILIGLIICGQMVRDMSHHWYDVIFGALLGMLCATMAFSYVYEGVWDERINDVPKIDTRFIRE